MIIFNRQMMIDFLRDPSSRSDLSYTLIGENAGGEQLGLFSGEAVRGEELDYTLNKMADFLESGAQIYSRGQKRSRVSKREVRCTEKHNFCQAYHEFVTT